jgi:hypothetical protein
MRDSAPFQPDDLKALGDLLDRAAAVVAMQEIAAGNLEARVIALRHDVDNDHALAVAVRMAEWEAERGYRSTYFLLHTSGYWNEGELRRSAERIAVCGHEIGIHANAVAEALRTGGDPAEILHEAIGELRSFGFPIRGVVAHGDGLCGDAHFVNDEMFVECARPAFGSPRRTLFHNGRALTLNPTPLASFGLTYESYRAGQRVGYLSDSGGRWNTPFADVAAAFPLPGQLHVLVHPDWWKEAF